jgi:hypothetical protein
MEISLSPGRLMGAFNAGVADGAWGDLPMPGPPVQLRGKILLACGLNMLHLIHRLA